jgi:hypothetical protein
MVSLTRPNSRPTHVYSSVRQGQILLKMLSFSPFLFSTLVSCPLTSLSFSRFSHQFPDHDTYVRNSNALWLAFPAEKELLQQELKKPREDFLSSMTITRLTTILGTIIPKRAYKMQSSCGQSKTLHFRFSTFCANGFAAGCMTMALTPNI